MNRFQQARPTDPDVQLQDVTFRVHERARRLLAEQPHLAGEDPHVVYSRLLASTLGDGPSFDYAASVNFAAMAVLLVAAIDRRDVMDITSGDAA